MATTIHALIGAYGDAQFACGDWDKHHCDESYEAVSARAETIRKVLDQALEFYCVRVNDPIVHLEVPGSFREAVKLARAFVNAYRVEVVIVFNPASGDFEHGPLSRGADEDVSLVGVVDVYGNYVHQAPEFVLHDVSTINLDREVHV
jgi:hypothetical protein